MLLAIRSILVPVDFSPHSERAADGELTLEEPADAVLRCARELPADAIVMGTRGLGAVRSALLGIGAEEVIRQAPCPVPTLHAG
jgi:nucleotide-binding universal stress UspA family protein